MRQNRHPTRLRATAMVSALALFMAMQDRPASADDFSDAMAHYEAGNYAAAFSLMSQEAHRGDRTAQYNLGNMHDNGEGTPANDIEAYLWTSLAKTGGYSAAEGNLNILKARMTREQIAEAQARAAVMWETLSRR